MPKGTTGWWMAMLAVLCVAKPATGQESTPAEPWPWGEDSALVGEPGGEPTPDAGGGGAGAGPAVAAAAPAADDQPVPGFPGDEKDLSLIEDEFGAAAGGKAATLVRSTPAPGARGAAAPGMDVNAFEGLLRENMTLRRQVDEALVQGDQAAADKRRLEQEMRELERQVSESVALIQKMKREPGPAVPAEGDAVPAPAVVSATSEEVEQLRARNASLQAQLDALQAQMDAATAAATAAAPPVSASPGPGSDLFRQLEAENAALKRQMAEAQAAQQAALDAQAAMTAQRIAAEASQAADQSRLRELEAELQILKRGIERVPGLQQELSGLRETVALKDRDLEARKRDLETLRLEMDKREQRLIKDERMAALLEKSRAEVKAVSKKEERDLHYNMAAVYSREGRHRDAEQAYLKALRADPTDAGSHYNLGILYEDVLEDKGKAAMHYRAYLKLAPNAEDVDQVKGWLLQLNLQ